MKKLLVVLFIMAIFMPRVAFAAGDSSWAEKVRIYGDFRYRHEMIDEEGTDVFHHHLIRARIGVAVTASEEVSLDFRFASGSPDPVSAEQPLDDGFISKNVYIDYAFMKYSPNGIKGLSFFAGKMINPYIRPGESDLMFDTDVTPEGIAIALAKGVGRTTLNVTLASFWVDERNTTSDTFCNGIQAALYVPFNDEKASFKVGFGYYDYTSIKGRVPTIGGFGNTLTGGVYANDYNLIEALVELGFSMKDIPFVIYGNYVTNGDPDDDNSAWLAGFTIGKAFEKGTWQFGYNYRYIEKDAILGAYADADFNNRRTDCKGHKFNFAYQFSNATNIMLTYYLNEEDLNSLKDYSSLQVDINVKF